MASPSSAKLSKSAGPFLLSPAGSVLEADSRLRPGKRGRTGDHSIDFEQAAQGSVGAPHTPEKPSARALLELSEPGTAGAPSCTPSSNLVSEPKQECTGNPRQPYLSCRRRRVLALASPARRRRQPSLVAPKKKTRGAIHKVNDRGGKGSSGAPRRLRKPLTGFPLLFSK